jgi:hypothetical protein
VGAAEALGGSIRDRLKYPVGVFVQLVVPNADDGPALCPEKSVASPIMI